MLEPSKEAVWRQFANAVVEYLQSEVELAYAEETTRRQLHLIGKILLIYKPFVTLKLKGVLLDRIFNLLRDEEITWVPAYTFSEILTSVRG